MERRSNGLSNQNGNIRKNVTGSELLWDRNVLIGLRKYGEDKIMSLMARTLYHGFKLTGFKKMFALPQVLQRKTSYYLKKSI